MDIHDQQRKHPDIRKPQINTIKQQSKHHFMEISQINTIQRQAKELRKNNA